MAVVLTGGTGLVGEAVLRALLASGHEVTALVRSDDSAAAVTKTGATTAVVGDITDGAWLRGQVEGSDGFVHTASPGDASSADFDRAVAQAAVAALQGTGKPFVHTGGAWVWGSGTGLREDDAFDAPTLTAWRAEVERLVLDADGVRGVVVAPGVVYGGGAGIPAILTTPDDSGSFRLIGDGTQHWTTVSADQVADLYVRVVEDDSATGYYIGVNDDTPTVREIAEAAASAGGDVVTETADESRARLGDLFAEALLLDQQVSNAKAKKLGWAPSGASLVDEARSGSYAPST